MIRRRPRRTARLAIGALLLVGLGLTATLTGAQTTPRAAPRGRAARPHKPADSAARADGGAPASPTARAPKGDAGADEVVAQKTLDGGTKVFRFGELEIEGRLKNPQLVFFLRRVRAEFAAGDLGHRSFLRELGETKRDPNF